MVAARSDRRCHGRQRQRRCRLGDADLMGISRMSLAAPRPRNVRRGHEHPQGKNQVLRNGPELRKTADCRDHAISRLGRMFNGPPLWRVLAFLGFWVPVAPHDTPRIGRGSRSACTTESRRWKQGNRAWPDTFRLPHIVLFRDPGVGFGCVGDDAPRLDASRKIRKCIFLLAIDAYSI